MLGGQGEPALLPACLCDQGQSQSPSDTQAFLMRHQVQTGVSVSSSFPSLIVLGVLHYQLSLPSLLPI